MQNRRKTKAELQVELSEAFQRIEQLEYQLSELEGYMEVLAEREHALMLERRERTSLEVMYQATTALYSALQYDQVLDHILDQLSQVVPHDAACIMLTQGRQARVFRWHGYRRFGAESTISSLILDINEIPYLAMMQQNGLPLVVSHVGDQEGWVSLSGQSWIKSYVGAPIRLRNRAVGFVHLDSATPGAFTEADAERLQAFLSHAVVALKNAWLYGEARREIMQRVKSLKAERNFVWSVLDQAGALVVILDAAQRIIRFNQACEKLTGYALEEVKQRHIWELFTAPGQHETVKATFERLAAGNFPLDYESEWVTRAGNACFIAWSSTVLQDHHGQMEYIINTGHDITDRRQIEEALRRGGERYALAVQAANDGLWDWNLESGEIYFSPRWKAIVGYNEHELQFRVEEWFNRVHPEDLARLKMEIGLYLEEVTSHFQCEYRMLHRDGDYRWVLTQGVAVRGSEGQPHRLTGSQTDVTGRKKNEDQLIHASLHDTLTGLPNRAFFMKRLERAVERANTDQDYLFALLFLDLDRFKSINDSLGHLLGDQLLITVARRLKTCLRSGDTVARLAGDEFTILLDGVNQGQDAVKVVERIQQELAEPVYLEGHEVRTSASIGVALSSTGYDSPQAILRDADITMYQAKAQGRGHHLISKAPPSGRKRSRRDREAELKQAIAHQELQLYYQPIVSLTTGRVAGVETLLRWVHPRRGVIMPDDFIPLAEASGLIVPIGQWVLQTACEQMQRWHLAGYASLRLSVNVSVHQFLPAQGQDLPAIVAAVLQETGLAPHLLELEITETVPLVDNDLNQVILNNLKKLGVNLALDDFGINSSLGLLRQFPIATLKIDRTFVQPMVKSAENSSVVAALIAMAHAFQVKVVAEGVETTEQLVYLQDQGCDEVQGYLFSPPVSAPELADLLQVDLLKNSD